jgi:hypothetical protein
MVELQSSFFVGGAIVFFVLLAIIIFGSRGSSVPTKAPKEKKKTQKKEKAAKPKSETVPLKKRTASKKSERVAEPVKKKFVVDTTNEANEVLEFLKGKDKAVIAQELALEEQKAAKQKGAVQKVDDTFVQPSRLISDKEAKAFLAVKPKAKKAKAEETEETTEEASPSPETKGKKGSKKFYKLDASEEAARKKKKEDYEERQAAKKRREENGGIDPLETPEQRAEKKRSWREKREDETDEEHQERIKPRKQRTAEDGTEEEKKPRGPKIPTFEEVDRAVKYEAADIGDLLSSIGASYKPTSATGPKVAPSKRYSSVFSNVTRENIRKILNNLSAADLCHLASVNHFFSSLVRNDDLWQALYVKDFGKKDKSAQHRTWRAAYRAANRSKSNEKAKNQKTEEAQ